LEWCSYPIRLGLASGLYGLQRRTGLGVINQPSAMSGPNLTAQVVKRLQGRNLDGAPNRILKHSGLQAEAEIGTVDPAPRTAVPG
jgi:hypothetical protein